MADDTKTPGPIKTATIGGNRPPVEDNSTVSVTALARFSKDGNPHGELVDVGDTLDVTRSRAAELRANGLIEYASESDDKDIHGNDAERHGERAKQRANQGKIDERNKSTPLRNPAVKLANLDDSK